VDEVGRLLVRVTAPPVDGAANEALVRLVTRELGIARRAVRLVSGARARVKRLEVSLDAERIHERWPGVVISD
jgi:uncharacterized protein YggU (UPF0235/DUF167 family)